MLSKIIAILVSVGVWMAYGRRERVTFYGEIAEQKNISLFVDELRFNGYIKSDVVANAMKKVDRTFFIPGPPFYEDITHHIGYGSITNPPHMIAQGLETLKDHLKEGSVAMDVGTGCGYMSVCMAEMVGLTGLVVAIDHLEGAVEYARISVGNYDDDYLSHGRVRLEVGDGRKGYPDAAPYDAIYVGGACSTVPPPLLEQLKNGGRMVIPIGQPGQVYMTTIDKHLNGTITEERGAFGYYSSLIDLDNIYTHVE